MNTSHLPDEMQELCAAFSTGLQAILGQKLYGVYIYGAAAFPDTLPSSDVDFHVIVCAELDEAETAALSELFAALARDYPPLGAELDGYVILLGEAGGASPPRHQLDTWIADNSWALHRAHVRAGRCIALYGPDPGETPEIYPPATWEELETALYGELKFVEYHLSEYPAYCILNLCRLIYSFETREVVISKAGAAAWALQSLPQWRRHIELARKFYAHQASSEEEAFMRDEAGALYRFAYARIQASLAAQGSVDRIKTGVDKI